MTDPQIAAYAISFLAGLALILRPGLVLVSLIFRPGLLLVVLAVAATLLSLAPAEAEAAPVIAGGSGTAALGALIGWKLRRLFGWGI